jgi:hypothetical protein
MLFFVYVASLRRADHSSKESYRLCKKNAYETEEQARAQQRAVQPLINERMKYKQMHAQTGKLSHMTLLIYS